MKKNIRTKFSLLTPGLNLNLKKRPNFLKFFEREFSLKKYHRFWKLVAFLWSNFLEFLNFWLGLTKLKKISKSPSHILPMALSTFGLTEAKKNSIIKVTPSSYALPWLLGMQGMLLNTYHKVMWKAVSYVLIRIS